MDESLSDLTRQKDQYEKKMGWLEQMKDIFLDEEDVEMQWDHLLTTVESIKQELAITCMDQKEVREDTSTIESLAFQQDMLADWVSGVGMRAPPPQIKAPKEREPIPNLQLVYPGNTMIAIAWHWIALLLDCAKKMALPVM